MGEAERGEACHVLVADGEALRSELGERSVHVDRVPQHDRVDDKAQGAELILLAFAIALAQLAALGVEHHAREGRFVASTRVPTASSRRLPGSPYLGWPFLYYSDAMFGDEGNDLLFGGLDVGRDSDTLTGGTSLELSPSTCSSCVNRLRVWDIRRFTEAGRSPSHPGAGAPRALVASTPMIPCAGDVQLQLPVAVHFLVDKSAPRLLAGSA
jgi:hypothetical protein